MKRNTSLTQLFRNGISMLCGILLLSASLSSCLDEPLFETPGRSDQGVKMYIRIPAPSISQTRAGNAIDDKYVDPSSVYVFVLSGTQDDSNVLQIVNAVAGTGDTYYAKLKESSTARYVYVVANAKDIIEKIGIEVLSKMTLSQLKLQLSKTVKAESGVISEPISLQPMFGEWELPSGITPETTIGTSVNPVLLVRATSKITIANKTTNGNFKLSGANLVNAPKLGYIVSGQAATGDRYPTGADGDINKMISTPTAGNETETVLYSFESAVKGEGQSTFVIIEAEYLNEKSYYRLNLSNKEGEYPLLRNNHYMVTINNVNKKGYGSVTEAMKNPAANIDYVVNVIDETGRNMVSNGEYYLAVSQTEFYYFSEEKGVFEKQEVAIVTHNAPESVLSGTCEVSDPNISIEDGGGFSKNTGGLQTFPLKVTMKNGITEGTITLKLGDLKREIKVYHREVNETFHFGALLNDFVKKGYIAGKVDKANESWITLSESENPTGENQHPSLESSAENIYVRVNAYLGDKADKYRDGAIDLFSKNEKGNARVKFHQRMFDVYTPSQQQAFLRPFTYIATFHRWNQTGERIIRVDAKVAGGSSNVNWKAFVITGDFIRLSKERSKDLGVGYDNFYGAGDHTTYDTATKVEALQIDAKDGTSEISSKDGGEPIYFRVGLTGKLASATAQPRYGLIALIVNTGIGQTPTTRYIYVRQGEAADYLMRPQDAVTYPSTQPMPARSLAKKISPFNLTDTRGLQTSNLKSEEDEKNAAFTEHPSQAGYLYQTTTKYGWWADRLDQNTSKDPNYKISPEDGEFTDKYEICPSGYRRPGENLETSKIETSEMRQSMWLYPQEEQIYETQNFIIGYMADGYYDRRPMKNEVVFTGYGENPRVPATTAYTTVESGAKIAYIGVLAFNPYSVASIFMPLTGYFRDANIVNQGMSSGFWTRARDKNSYWSVDTGYLYPGDNSSSTIRFLADNYKHDGGLTSSIRCIKDE